MISAGSKREPELRELHLRWAGGNPVPVDVEARAVAKGYDVETLRKPFY